jgi:hypothetical protein
MTRASMGRVVHPRPPYFVSGIVTCPGCGTMWWGSVSECRCGAAVILLHGRRGRWIDPTRRAYLVGHDGSAYVLEPGAREATPVTELAS